MRNNITLRFLAGLAILAALFAAASGCETPLTPAQTSAIIGAGNDTIAVLDAQIADAQARLAQLEPGSDAYKAAAKAIDIAVKARSVTAKSVMELEGALDEEGNITPEGGVSVITNLLPPPFNVIFALAAGTGVGVWRSRKVRDAAHNIAASIEQAMKASPKLSEAMADPEVTAALSKAQTPLAKKIVDEAQGKKSAPIL